MFAKLHRKSLSVSLGLLLAGASAGTWAASATPAVDTGAAPSNQTVQVTLILKLHDEAALEDYIRQTVTPGSAHYQQFLTTRQFAQRYGATDADIARVQSYLRSQGLSSEVLPSHLAIRTSGTLTQFGKLFQTSIHNYVSRENGRSFHKPASAPQLPSAIADVVNVATGLSNEKVYRPHHVSTPALAALGPANARTNALAAQHAGGASNPTASGIPGEYTVATWRTSTTSIRSTSGASSARALPSAW